MADKQLKSLQFPNLDDRYVVKLTIDELQKLLASTKLNGGVAFRNELFSKEYEELLNKPDLSKYIEKGNLKEEIKSLNYVTINNLDDYKTELKKELIGAFKDGSGNPIWTINRIGTSFLEKTEVNFKLYNEQNEPEYTAIEYKQGVQVEGEPIPANELIYYIGETAIVVGEVFPSTDNEKIGIIKWKDNHFNYKQIQFSVSEEEIPERLLDWLQYVGTQDKDTIRGLKTYIDVKNKSNMDTLTTTIETTIAKKLPIASKNTLGVIKIGTGLTIGENTGVLSVDIDQVSGVKPSWSNITGWPTEETLKAGNDIYYNTIIKTFGDLYKKNQSDLDNFYTKLEDYRSLQNTVKTIQTTVDKIQSQELRPATKTTLGGVMPDDETIKIDSTGKISGIKVTWREWTK